MDAARRRELLSKSDLGKAIVRDEDKAGEADYQRAAQQVREAHPLSEARRQKLLALTPLGKSALRHEEQMRQR